MRLGLAILCCALLVARPLSTADAGTALALEVADLAERADLVVEGRVIDARSETTDSGLIVTEWELSVTRSFHGDDSGPNVSVRLPGGVVGDVGMLVPGMPEIVVGEEVLLFTTGEGHAGFRMPIGLAQGKFRVVTDLSGARSLQREQSDLELLDAHGRLRPAASKASYDYAEVVAEIHRGLARKEWR